MLVRAVPRHQGIALHAAVSANTIIVDFLKDSMPIDAGTSPNDGADSAYPGGRF